MCDAVAACHEQSIFHRDIKPENFIVTDGWVEKQGRDGNVVRERKVVVKLTDFGLGTMDTESADMDCGSAPYMSFGMHSSSIATMSANYGLHIFRMQEQRPSDLLSSCGGCLVSRYCSDQHVCSSTFPGSSFANMV